MFSIRLGLSTLFSLRTTSSIESGGTFEEDLPVPESAGVGITQLLRLREGIERHYIDDMSDPAAAASIQSQIPVMFEREPFHITPGINVLFMDGHVEFVKMEMQFPAQQWFLDALAQLENEY